MSAAALDGGLDFGSCDLLPDLETRVGSSIPSTTLDAWVFGLDLSRLEAPLAAFGEVGRTDCSAACSAMVKERDRI